MTNHSFVNGRAVGFQSILAAGTSVLVDDYGNPVARCRCGNPLLKPVFIATATCIACPPRYKPPPACPYTEETIYRRRWYPGRYYSNAQYDEIFIRRFRSSCYSAYPDPPRVRITDIYDPDLKPAPDASAAAGVDHAPGDDDGTAPRQRVGLLLTAIGTGLPVLHPQRLWICAQPHAVDLARPARRRPRELLDDDAVRRIGRLHVRGRAAVRR